jgi:type IV secretory pathway VirB2 component (pilin)
MKALSIIGIILSCLSIVMGVKAALDNNDVVIVSGVIIVFLALFILIFSFVALSALKKMK